MDVYLLCLYFVFSYVGRRLCDELITRPEESYLKSNFVWLRNFNTEEEKAQRGLYCHRKKNNFISYPPPPPVMISKVRHCDVQNIIKHILARTTHYALHTSLKEIWSKININLVTFQVLTGRSREMALFCDVVRCRLVDIDRRFRWAYCLHHQFDHRQ
jgi:hypothetical protein